MRFHRTHGTNLRSRHRVLVPAREREQLTAIEACSMLSSTFSGAMCGRRSSLGSVFPHLIEHGVSTTAGTRTRSASHSPQLVRQVSVNEITAAFVAEYAPKH